MSLDLLTLAAGASLLLAHAAILGLALLGLAGMTQPQTQSPSNALLLLFFAFTTGLAVDIAALFLLAALGILTAPAVMTLAAALALLGGGYLAARRPKLSLAQPIDALSTLMAGGFFLLAIVVCYHPPGAWDDTMYHLPLARHYLEQGSLALHEFVRFPLFPQNINLLMSLGLMFGDARLAQVFVTLPLFIIALGLMGLSQIFCGRSLWGAVAAALVFVIRPVRETLGYAYVDNALALFCFAATIVLVLAPSTGRGARGWLLIAGLLAGTAAGSKLFGGVYAALLGLWVLLRRRQLAPVVYFCAATAIVGIGWYLRSFLISGDPVHPAGGPVFGHYLWDAADLASQKGEQQTHGVSRHPLNMFSALATAGVIGWILAFIGIALRQVPPAIRQLQWLFLGYFCFWFFVTQVSRYLAPVFAIGMFLSVYTVYRFWQWLSSRYPALKILENPKVVIGAGMIVSLAGTALIAAHYHDRDLAGALKRRLGLYAGQTPEALLQSRPGYQLFTQANGYTDTYGPRLMQLGFENAVYFFNGTVIGDWYGPGRYKDSITCERGKCTPLPADKMRERMLNFNARMIAVSSERYPAFDRNSYLGPFTLLYQDAYGALYALEREPQ